jgi:hypothetical protein
MNSGRNRVRARLGTWEQLLLLVLLLPGLVLGATLDGQTAWFHSHGPAGDHLHLLFASADLDGHERASVVEQLHSHEGAAPEDEHDAPAGIWIELPRILAASTRNASQPQVPVVQASAPLPPVRWRPVTTERLHRPDACRFGWPARGRELSGVAALLRSSHAILI